MHCVFSSDPAVSSSVFVGIEREENLIRNDPTRASLRLNGFKSSEFSLVAACLWTRAFGVWRRGHLIVEKELTAWWKARIHMQFLSWLRSSVVRACDCNSQDPGFDPRFNSRRGFAVFLPLSWPSVPSIFVGAEREENLIISGNLSKRLVKAELEHQVGSLI